MENLLITLVLLVLVGFIALLIAGATNKVVIYYDIKDFAISFAPWGLLLITAIIASFYEKENQEHLQVIQKIMWLIGTLVAAVFFYWSIRLSIFYNRSVSVGIIVGLFKVISALIGVLVVVSSVLKIMDKKSSMRDVMWAMLIISIFAWLGKKLINGEQVYIAKG